MLLESAIIICKLISLTNHAANVFFHAAMATKKLYSVELKMKTNAYNAVEAGCIRHLYSAHLFPRGFFALRQYRVFFD